MDKGEVMKTIIRAVMVTLFLLVFPVWVSAGAVDKKPKLILQITVDQLRGDLPTRYYDRLGKGGLRYLLDKGVVYNNAHHAHANTETIVGHVTLATGAHPSAHGMIGNLWFDRSTGVTTYNIEDSNYKLLSEGADIDASTEIDPTQKAASSDGRSPAAILTTTFSDELSSLTAGKAKVFGISVKDRGAVSMAGIPEKHSGFQSRPTNLLPAVIIIKSIHSGWSTGTPKNCPSNIQVKPGSLCIP